jgi:hypothetical protein
MRNRLPVIGKAKMMLYLISGDPYNLFCHRNTDMTTHDNHYQDRSNYAPSSPGFLSAGTSCPFAAYLRRPAARRPGAGHAPAHEPPLLGQFPDRRRRLVAVESEDSAAAG